MVFAASELEGKHSRHGSRDDWDHGHGVEGQRGEGGTNKVPRKRKILSQSMVSP